MIKYIIGLYLLILLWILLIGPKCPRCKTRNIVETGYFIGPMWVCMKCGKEYWAGELYAEGTGKEPKGKKAAHQTWEDLIREFQEQQSKTQGER